MAGRRLLYGGASGGGGGDSIMNTVLLENQRVPYSSSKPRDSFFLSGSSPSFGGSRSILSFEDVSQGNGSGRSFFHSFDIEENADEDFDEYSHQPEKKRRLKADQVEFLEKNFETENKLEPEKKIQLAKELGLQPRQIAIWFQNRRARWKTKQLEKDYEVLQDSYVKLKTNYENLLKEKDKLKAEVLKLSDELLLKEKDKENSESFDAKSQSEALQQEHVADRVYEKEVSKRSMVGCKQDNDDNTVKSYVFDSESPHYTDGAHSSILEPGDSSYVFEQDQSDVSQDEENNNNLSKRFPPSLAYMFPKVEDPDYPDSDPPGNSCYFGFPVDDQSSFGTFWSC